MRRDEQTSLAFGCGIVAVVILGIAVLFVAWPYYRVWQREMAGKSELAQATWNRKIAIEEADAQREAATKLAAAEVERAKGVAEANRIIGDSLKGNTDYLKYLWVQGLHDGNTETIYIPVETNLPILEATRRGQ